MLTRCKNSKGESVYTTVMQFDPGSITKTHSFQGTAVLQERMR